MNLVNRGERLEHQARFEAFYASEYRAVYLYVHRRLSATPGEVPDVVAEVFAVAWCRLDEVPDPPKDRLWLYGVARNSVMHQRRTNWRRWRLQNRLGSEPPSPPINSAEVHEVVRGALERLRAQDQEVLRLVFWDGLSHAEAAEVLHCSVNAVAVRLRRAKQRLRRTREIARLRSNAGEFPTPETQHDRK